MNKTTLFAFLMLLLTPLFAVAQVMQNPTDDARLLGPELDPASNYQATFETTLGTIKLELFAEKSPNTVRNFVNLIEGTKPWKNPKTNVTEQKPYYDGIVFHRVIRNFMIQGGDPTGTGRGGPGFRFGDEVNNGYTFDNMEYVLAMANAGPNTNGSQFFITDKGSFPSHLNGKHTIFGKVIEGKDVVDAIAASDKNNPPKILKATVTKTSKGETAVATTINAAEEVSKDVVPASAPAASAPAVPASKPASQPASAPAQ